jgi:enoyl-CoA hydratase/carnithine racemase
VTEPKPLLATDLVVERTDPTVAVVTIGRPRQRNAVTLAMWRELARIFTALANEQDLRSIILTGAGGAFSAGADITEFPAVRSTVDNARAYEAAGDAAQAAIANSPKATIAAVTGPCYGGGVGLALSCDFRVADRTAHFAIPAARLSNVYGVVETRALFDAVGLAAAKEVLFTGKRYDAAEAHAIGLATHMAPEGETAIAAAHTLAAGMRASAPLTIKGAKIVLGAIARSETAERRDAIHHVMDEAISSDDYKEGVAAFAAKRDPVFKGR